MKIMTNRTQHFLVFFLAFVLYIIAKVYLPKASIIVSILIAIYVSNKIIKQEMIYKIVKFIMGKDI